MTADAHEVEVVVAHHERATLRVGEVFLKIDDLPGLSAGSVHGQARVWSLQGGHLRVDAAVSCGHVGDV